MRKSMYPAVIRFRASEDLLAAAEVIADKRGMSLSELVRDALRQMIEPGSAKTDHPPVAGPEGLAQPLFAEAAQGSLVAQRALRDQSWGMALDGRAPFDQAFAVSEAFARMASTQGDANDHTLLAAILFKRAQLFSTSDQQAIYCAAEGLTFANKAADAGHEHVGAMLANLPTLGFPQELYDMARAMQRADEAAATVS